MEQIPESTSTTKVLPVLANMQDRGSILFDSKDGSNTASTIQKAITYCKDLQGCGDADYRSVSAAVSLNFLDNCTPRLNGVLSVSGLFYKSASPENITDMLFALRDATGAGFDQAAGFVCPQTIG